jgi:tetratricopeptide (TPR) repeat protein
MQKSTLFEIEDPEDILEYQRKILDAFYVGDLAKAARMCGALLHEHPENTFAQTYLDKVHSAWKKGHGVPFELRRQLKQVHRLEDLREYSEARSLCESLLGEARSLGIFHWPDIEETLLRLDQAEKANRLAEKANELLSGDNWEGALDLYAKVVALAADSKDSMRIDEEYRAVQSLLDKEESISAVLAGCRTSSECNLDALVQALEDVHTLKSDQPDSSRVEKLLLDVKSTAAKVRQEAVTEVETQLDSDVTSSGTWIAEEKLLETQHLLDFVTRVPGDPQPIEDLLQKFRTRKANFVTIQRFETKVMNWVLQKDAELKVTRMNPWMTAEQLSALTAAMRQVWIDWRQFGLLMSEYEFCSMALSCSTPSSIANLGRGIDVDQPALSGTIWWEAWHPAKEQMLTISKDVARSLRKPKVLENYPKHQQLVTLEALAQEQIFPLSQLTYAISLRWREVLEEMLQ